MELGAIIFMNDGILAKQDPDGVRGKVGFMTITSNNIYLATRVPALQGLLQWLTEHDARKGKRVDESFHGGPAWLLTKTKTNREWVSRRLKSDPTTEKHKPSTSFQN